MPKELLQKVEAGQAITDEEAKLFKSHPEIAGKLLASIPRLEDVAAIVAAQFGDLSFAGKPADVAQWDIRSAGQEVTNTLIVKLTSIAGGVGVIQPFRVRVAS
jgi:hypothetical protein